MIFNEENGIRYEYDDVMERDPTDRAVIDKLRRYAEARGGTATEFDGNQDGPCKSNFVFGWEGRYVVYFRCVGSYHSDFEMGCEVDLNPPDMLSELRHLRRIRTTCYAGNLSWLGELGGLETVEIDATPGVTERFPTHWSCATTLRLLMLCYSTDSIDYVPASVKSLTKLRELVIRVSRPKPLALPDWLGDLSNLERLHIQGHLDSIPHSLTHMELCFTDDYTANHGIILDHVALSHGDVGMYLSNDRTLIDAFYTGEQEAIRECKIIFLGDGGAGKSSLIERMMTDKFEPGKLPTEGMRVIKWDTSLDERPFCLRFLDFGGQQIMHSMHRCFLSNHTVYVIVCAVRDDMQIHAASARWLEQVRTYAPDCPVILVLNKTDENPDISVNETSLRTRYPSLKEVLKTSAKNGNGLAQLLDRIKSLAPDCVQELRGSKAMLSVKRTLENMGGIGEKHRNYITAREYEKLCEDNGIHDRNVQFSMLNWFRDLGVAYFYRPNELDVRLESLRVLDPAWLTNGIYRLINHTKNQVNNGILSHDDIRDVLQKTFPGEAVEDLQYNSDEAEYVLHVMRLFRISHEMKEEGKELIPMLMDVEPPVTVNTFPKREAVHMRWEGAFLPNNLIHRLMVEEYRYLDFQCMWRTGARFYDRTTGCEALAEMDDRNYETLDLFVVRGSAEERREFLRHFREKIKAILQSLNLHDTEENLCCEIDGKEDYLPYKTIVASLRSGDKRIMLPKIAKHASPAELLLMVETDPVRRKELDEQRKEAKDRQSRQHEKLENHVNRATALKTYVDLVIRFLILILIIILLAKGTDLLELIQHFP